MKTLFQSRKILTIFLLFLFSLILITVLAGKMIADDQAAAFIKKNEVILGQKQDIQKKSQALQYSEKIIVGRPETSSEREAIKKECQTADELAQAATLTTEKPKLPNNIFGFLSGSYLNAKKKTYHHKDTEQISQLSKAVAISCDRYIEEVELFVRYNKYEKERKALVIPTGTNNCLSSVGCISPSNELSYKKYYKESVTLNQKYLSILQRGGCEFSELQQICDLHLGYYKKDTPLSEAYYNALGGGGDINIASNALAANPFPTDQTCKIARSVTGDNTIKDHCYTRAIKSIAKMYETKIISAAKQL